MTRRHTRMMIAAALFLTVWMLIGSAMLKDHDPTTEQSIWFAAGTVFGLIGMVVRDLFEKRNGDEDDDNV